MIKLALLEEVALPILKLVKGVTMSRDRTVTVKYVPPTTDEPILEMSNIRIEIDEDHPNDVWIWMLEDGVKVEGGCFSLQQFMDVILDFYNKEY
jgi:hypothetical protein